MKCTKCNAENEEGALYCIRCQNNLKDSFKNSFIEQQSSQDIQNKNVSEAPIQTREPILAGILSFFFMGLGQAYNGLRRKGYMFFMVLPLSIILYFILHALFGEPMPKTEEEAATFNSPSYLITAIFWFVIWISNIYDAYQSAKRVNEGEIIVEETAGRSAFIFLRNTILGSILAGIAFIVLLVLFFPLVCALKR